MAGILARKIEMTRVIKGNKFVPVTLLEVPKMQVVGYKTFQNDGYSALIVGIVKDGEVSLQGGKKTLNVKAFSEIREFAIDMNSEGKKEVGSEVGFDDLEGVESVSLTGISKGKGFAGAMKRHNFKGGNATHGSKFHRALGGIGTRKPRRTKPGKKMHGHMGLDTITLKNIPLELVNRQAGIIGVRGPVPGARTSLVQVYFNTK